MACMEFVMISGSAMFSLLGVLIAFAMIVLLIRRRYNFGLSLLIGSFILAFFSLFVTSSEAILKAVIQAVIFNYETGQFQFQTIALAILMTLIYLLASLMQDTGAIADLIDSLRAFFSRGGTIALIPAIYGLMPVPGGALFSAPVVDEEGNRFQLQVDKKNFFNIWFRHIWFPVYPISSSILIMADLADVNMYALIVTHLVVFFAMIFIGFILLRKIVINDEIDRFQRKSSVDRNAKGFLFLLPPVVPLCFSVLSFAGILSLFPSFIIGVLFSIVLLYFLSDVSFDRYKKFLKNGLTWKLAAVILGIMLFREIFSVSGANQAIFSILQQLPIPILLVIIAFPFILGILTGYLLSGITLSYILVSPLFQAISMDTLGLVSILFISGFIGYLISPIHLCNVLSSEYLKTDTTRMYNIFIPSALILLIIHIIFVVLFF